ncbi:unnamed protein product [Prunus armeniaca]
MICKLANYVDKNLKKQYNCTLKVITDVYVREKSGTETVTFKRLGAKAISHFSLSKFGGPFPLSTREGA